jgi:hypothetical protein
MISSNKDLAKNKKIHLGIGHYGIGFKDGVNTVIARNVRALFKINPNLKITLFGKLAPNYTDFLEPIEGRLEYRNIEEFNADTFSKPLGKSIFDQEVHDYIWLGTKLVEILIKKLADMDVILVENLGIGIQPSVTYAFYLYAQYIYNSKERKKLIYRFHDFVQQRPTYFKNVKKFHHYRFGFVPHWHSILYPEYPNVNYITLNRYDQWRLFEHGIDEKNVHYIPNSVDDSFVPPDDRSDELRNEIIEKNNLDKSVTFLLYPVRCIRRKNIEEAIFLTKLLNSLSEGKSSRKNAHLKGNFHLLVGLKALENDDIRYCDQITNFIKTKELPVTIGFNDLVSLDRHCDPNRPDKIKKYCIGDLYRVADLIVTTSILEGFGFSYIEPWVVDRAVIGRSIPFITPDFQATGMKLGHLYSALLVDRQDYKDIGRGEKEPDKALELRLQKILNLDDPEFIDNFFINNETTILATLRLFNEEKRREIIKINKEIVETVYSQDNVGKKLNEVITTNEWSD